MLLIAGLGNPGPKYAKNRHNIGFMAADAIVRRHSFSPWQKKFSGLVSEGNLSGERVIVLKPQTFMNHSGQAVGEALRFYKLELKDLVVIYDELDLFPGKVRVKTGGGSGGHNGIKSIDAHCGKDYRRLRLGIGHPGIKELVHNHVLGDFAKADQLWLEPLLDAVADASPLLAKSDDSGFMNKVAVSLGQGDQRKAEAPKAESHIRQARPHAAPKLPQSGPMAAMLRRFSARSDPMDASVIRENDVIYYAAVSLDGFIAGKDGDVKWLDGYFIPELGFHDFIKRIGGLIMGRRTFDKIAGFGKWPYGELRGTVATHRDFDGTFGPVEKAAGAAEHIYASAKAFSPGPHWLVSGADLASQFLDAGLLTRIDLFVIPVLLGEGIPAFVNKEKVGLVLIDSQTYPKGIVRLSYSSAL